jgi:hypothetical protein
MYRWSVELSQPDRPPENVTVEVPARGAEYTLQRLGGIGHPIHLSLVDAHLSGQVRQPPGWALGRDSQAVAANLLGPPVWLYRAGLAVATLEDIQLLPSQPSGFARYRICCRGVLRHVWTTDRAGTAASDWDEVAVALPETSDDSREPGCIRAFTRVATSLFRGSRQVGDIRGSTPSMSEEEAWGRIEAWLGVPIEERRKEPLAVRIIGRTRTTSLLVGWSLVLPRNQKLFAAWLGSDGRLELRPAIRKRSK